MEKDPNVNKWLVFLFGLAGIFLLSPIWVPEASAFSISADAQSRPGSPLAPANMPAAYTGCGGVTAPVVNADYEQQVLDLVNTERANSSLPPFKRVTELDQAARYHATDMGQDGYFKHDSYDGVGGPTWVCAWSTRISSYYSGWNSLAENIAAGQTTPQDVMTEWMTSPGHRDNILSTGNWEIGVGYYQGSGAYSRYWVQDFGRRSGIYPLIINRDAATTNSQNVSIYAYGSWTQMRLKNDAGSWGGWQPFQSSFSWTLGGGVGIHAVTAELSNGTTTVSTSDTVFLNGPSLPTLDNVPDSILFTYSNADQFLIPSSSTVTPANISSSDALTWSLLTSGSWFTALPGVGTTPNSFTITPASFAKGSETTFTGAVTVTVTSPSGVGNSPKRINLTLQVTNQPFSRQFFPFLKK